MIYFYLDCSFYTRTCTETPFHIAFILLYVILKSHTFHIQEALDMFKEVSGQRQSTFLELNHISSLLFLLNFETAESLKATVRDPFVGVNGFRRYSVSCKLFYYILFYYWDGFNSNTLNKDLRPISQKIRQSCPRHYVMKML